MSRIRKLLDLIENTPDCSVLPSVGVAEIAHNHVLPDDILEFYNLCGGAVLYGRSAYTIQIVGPSKVLPANPLLFIGLTPDELSLEKPKDDISWSWYIIGVGENQECITIDLSQERLGRCYDSFWDSHAIPGSSPIIALSFTDLLVRLLENQGRHWYWCRPDFNSLGDAYD
jgi:hypothetical protein